MLRRAFPRRRAAGPELSSIPGQIAVNLQRRGPALEPATLLRHCGLCPLPLQVNGVPVQVGLAQAYRGCQAAWSDAIPASLKPAGPGNLNTCLPVFMARTPARQPLWVAVVGGVSYPFLLPEAGSIVGIVWSLRLRTDAGLSRVVQDPGWDEIRAELLRLSMGHQGFQAL